MPVEHIGFALQPCGFFDRNPAMNEPQEVDSDSIGVHVKSRM